jgi:hypothetical protein
MEEVRYCAPASLTLNIMTKHINIYAIRYLGDLNFSLLESKGLNFSIHVAN